MSVNDMTTFYPKITPHQTYALKVSELHRLHIEESGNPQGTPAVFLHGGPGVGIHPDYHRFFDPEKYRIIVFDQRGSGKSTPPAEIKENTTAELVDDLEKIRRFLEIDQWLVVGGSWGSTYGLAYAQAYPDSVLQLVLRGIFLARQFEIDWLFKKGASELFPDAWQAFVGFIPEDEREDLVKAYDQRLNSPDESICLAALKSWNAWEGTVATLYPSPSDDGDDSDLARARIECYYALHNFFLEEGQLFNNLDRIKHIPCVLVQGRYDVISPVRAAFDLKRAWPDADLRIVPDAGHSTFEPGIVNEIVAATDAFARPA